MNGVFKSGCCVAKGPENKQGTLSDVYADKLEGVHKDMEFPAKNIASHCNGCMYIPVHCEQAHTLSFSMCRRTTANTTHSTP